MNFFSTDAFLLSLAGAYFPDRPSRPEDFQVGRRVYRLLRAGDQVVRAFEFADFLEPLDEGAVPAPSGGRLRHLPAVARRAVPRSAWRRSPFFDAAPFVRWDRFGRFADFAQGRKGFGRHEALLRRLERRAGPLELIPDDPREATLRLGLSWKSEQYRASGHADSFADPQHVRFFEALRERGALRISTLAAGGRPVAIHVGAHHAGRLYYWLPAYDRAWASFSPGRLLLEKLLAHSFEAQDREFDFLIGAEPYKLEYATDVRIIGPAGLPPLRPTARALKAWAKERLPSPVRALLRRRSARR